jgi:CheY-like chemotaxis protein
LVIADDDVRVLATYELILEKAGHRVIRIFNNGNELVDDFRSRLKNQKQVAALRTNDENIPEAIILDYKMPDMDGIEAAKLLRKMGIRLKIIIVSAFDLPSESNHYYDVLLRKPIMADQLLSAVAAGTPKDLKRKADVSDDSLQLQAASVIP